MIQPCKEVREKLKGHTSYSSNRRHRVQLLLYSAPIFSGANKSSKYPPRCKPLENYCLDFVKLEAERVDQTALGVPSNRALPGTQGSGRKCFSLSTSVEATLIFSL